MKFLKSTMLMMLILIFTASAQQKSFISYYEMRDFYQASPGAFKYGLYGFQNPAITSYMHDFDMLFTVSGQPGDVSNFDRWGIFTGSPYSGFGFLHDTRNGKSVNDYRLSTAFGSRDFSLGVGYGFTGGDKAAFGRSNIIYAGALIRPLPQVSVGLSRTWALDNTDAETVAEIAVRPIGSLPVALFADMAMFDDQNLDAAGWSAGASVEVIDGFRINGRYFEDETFTVGVDLSIGAMGFGSNSQFDANQEYDYNAWSIRLGALDRTVLENIMPIELYLVLDLKGDIKYQRYKFFDDGKTLFAILKKIDEAKNDDNIGGIVINTSGMSVNMEMMWEIREKLREFKDSGKEVIIFADRMGIREYHFASVADEIVMDEFGMLTLEGYMLGRSYYKKMLEDVNIGFEEIRLFKYKSAAETYAREKMSDADREQRQALVDDWYEISKTEIMKSRGFTDNEFEGFVNDNLIFTVNEAMENNLIDRKGRWTNYKKIVKEITGRKVFFTEFGMYQSKPRPFDDKWSAPQNNIAIVYAIGECAMESGIKARKLAQDMEKVMKDNSVSAVVLRVDSPGGDAMASDYIAEIIRRYKDKKPVIVSQGMVAASGGYWLSMDADKIVAAPMTITGSIGVIAAWMYDKGLANDIGITTDLVLKGKHADLGHTWRLPLIGLGLPVRNLTDEELNEWKEKIKVMYDEFVTMVANGRQMDKDKVAEIAQGRVWSGMDGNENGLVDNLGGLWKAIETAKKEAGIELDEYCTYEQYPEPELFDFGSLLFGMAGVKVPEIGYEAESLIWRAENNGKPMPILPLDYMQFTLEPDFD